MSISLKKVGGIYFWQVGRIGGSFHVKAAPVSQPRGVSFDTFGLACCAVLALSAFPLI